MSADVHVLAARRLALQAQRYTASRRALVDRLHAAPPPLPIPAIVEGRHDLALSSGFPPERHRLDLIGVCSGGR